MAFLLVGLGGAIGAMARYVISLIPVRTGFPMLTLITNVLGAILIGFVVGIASADDNVPEGMVLLLKTGVCGGFTTFSTFSLEAYDLIEGGRYAAGGAYVLLSCLGCILGVLCGKRLASLVRA